MDVAPWLFFRTAISQPMLCSSGFYDLSAPFSTVIPEPQGQKLFCSYSSLVFMKLCSVG